MAQRAPNELRRISMIPHYVQHPAGSVLISFGDTRVLCTASVADSVPRWMSGSGKGWVNAEYDMLPSSTHTRKDRDSHKGRITGRTQEISRLVGRALRSVVNLSAIGERAITVDCDVIQADGGTRTAAITGGYTALAIAINRLIKDGIAKPEALRCPVTAISVGMIDGKHVLDLDYNMDSRADVDLNVVMTGGNTLAEVQGTGEEATFSRDDLNAMLDLAFAALPKLTEIQKMAIAAPYTNTPTEIFL